MPVMNGMMKLKIELSLTDMEVEIPSHSLFENQFNVRSVKRSFALIAP